MKSFTDLKRNLKKDFRGLATIKVALIGDSATQFLADAIRGQGYEFGIYLNLFEADFNQVERQVFDPSSELYRFMPDVVIVFHSSHKLLQHYNKANNSEKNMLAATRLKLIEQLYRGIKHRMNSKFIYYNYPEIDDAIFGNFANKISFSFLAQLRNLNTKLMEFALVNSDFFLADLSSLQNKIGRNAMFSPNVYINSEMVLSIDSLPMVAERTVAIISALQGKIKKCLVLDLDNTLWGGVIGDDGLENIQIGNLGIGKAFTEFQYWIKKLKERGIIIAVCSKNTDSVAREPFEKHPEMVLHIDDFAVFVANWENKADNIRSIQKILNIGFDSMVFLDDNPFERTMVRENIPGITVPELPDDPAEYLEYLYSLNLFETVSYSTEDIERTRQYQEEVKRVRDRTQFVNEDDFLKSMSMKSEVSTFTKYNTPRVAQLTQRSNQFNLRTIRYTEEDIERIGNDTNYYSFAFTLEDKFGDNGLISVVILKDAGNGSLFIDSWLMSCRVLKRGMEIFVLNTIVESALRNGFNSIVGEYIPTPKNEMVKDHYASLGFTKNGELWVLKPQTYKTGKCFIIKK
jgi:FkbH-like protein